MERFNNNDIIRKLNNCNHIFHLSCIDQWFSNNTRCPICRDDIRNTNNTEESDTTNDNLNGNGNENENENENENNYSNTS